jgi:hypothetical protein
MNAAIVSIFIGPSNYSKATAVVVGVVVVVVAAAAITFLFAAVDCRINDNFVVADTHLSAYICTCMACMHALCILRRLRCRHFDWRWVARRRSGFRIHHGAFVSDTHRCCASGERSTTKNNNVYIPFSCFIFCSLFDTLSTHQRFFLLLFLLSPFFFLQSHDDL